MAVQVGAVVLATQACGSTSACALQPLAGRAALAYLLDALCTSPRLRPLHARLAIVASAATAADVRTWAARSGLEACVCVAGGGAATASQLLREALQHPALRGATHVVVADGSKALEPGTSIARMVEAAVIQAAPMTAGVCVPLAAAPGAAAALAAAGGAPAHEVELESQANTGSRVTALRAPPAACAAPPGGSAPEHAPADVLAPLCVLERGALLEAAARAGGGEAPEALCRGVLDAGGAVRSWRLEPPLDLSTPEAARLADAFFKHYAATHQRLCWELQQAASASTRSGADDPTPEVLARCTLVQLEERLNQLGISQAAAFTGQLRPPGGDCEPYGGFRPVFEHWLGGYLASMDSRAANPFAKDYKHLPDRFKDATSFAHRPRAEHACYTTSSAEYGAKRATGLDMPLAW